MQMASAVLRCWHFIHLLGHGLQESSLVNNQLANDTRSISTSVISTTLNSLFKKLYSTRKA
jgi:DNA-binding HxlR family transcriptional regulator